MAVSTVSFMLLDIVKVLIIRNWSFELTAKLWPSNKNKLKLRERQERATLLERVDNNIAKVRRAVIMSSAMTAFKSGVKYVKTISKSVLNISGLDDNTVRSRRPSVETSKSKLDASKQGSVTDVNKSSALEEEDEEQEGYLESPLSDSHQ